VLAAIKFYASYTTTMFFEITEYLFYFFYQKYFKMDRDIPGVFALGLITILQFLNIAFVGMILHLFHLADLDRVSNISIVVTMMLLLSVNYLYIYKKRGRERILLKYSNRTTETQRIRKISLLYILITVLFFLALFTYLLFVRPRAVPIDGYSR